MLHLVATTRDKDVEEVEMVEEEKKGDVAQEIEEE